MSDDKEKKFRGLDSSQSFWYRCKMASYRVSKWPEWKRKIRLTENSPEYDPDEKVRRYL